MTRILPPRSRGLTPYLGLVAPQVRRALSLLDDDPASPTYGCFDRAYWHYRTLVDFPGAAWQQLIWPLAWLYRLDQPDNYHAGKPELLAAAAAGLRWWARIQKRDGSFDEWYRNEHSYCPTAFTTAAATEALLLLDDALPDDVRAAALAAAERAGAWLEPRFNATVMNQNLAAGLALWNLGVLTGASRWRQAAEARFASVAAAQHAEGWLPEYGGADFGYSTLALDLLGAADARGAGPFVRPIAERLARFLLEVRGAGPGHAGRLGSRGTAHVFPYGADHFAAKIPEAAVLAMGWRSSSDGGAVISPADVDDRYFAYFHLTQLALACGMHVVPLVVFTPSAVSHLPGAGLTIVRRESWSAAVSARLGGAVAVERPPQPPAYLPGPAYFLGYELTLSSGEVLASHHWDPGASVSEPSDEGGTITLRCHAMFVRRKRSLPLVRWSVAFPLFTRLLAVGGLAEAFQAMVKRRMINPRARRQVALERTVAINETEVLVRDEIRLLGAQLQVESLQASAQVCMHSPSARQDRGRPLPFAVPSDAAERLTRGRTIVIEHRFAIADLP